MLAGLSHRTRATDCRTRAARAAIFALLAAPGCTFWDMDDWALHEGQADLPTVLAQDTFTREVQSGLGTADIGGAWSIHGNDTTFAVADGVASLTLDAAGAGPLVALDDVSTDDADVQVVLSTDKLGGGSGLYTSVIARAVDDDRSYYTTLALHDDGTIDAILIRKQSTEDKIVRSSALLTVGPDEPVRVRMQATGTAPTHLRMKAWKATEAEPGAWTLEVTDETPELQTPGSVGISSYLSSTATNAPLRLRFDDFVVRTASRMP